MSEQDAIKRLLERLRESLQDKSQQKCIELIGIITEYFEGPAESSEISKLFVHFFKSSGDS